MKKYFLLISFFVLPAVADNPTCGENGVVELMALFNPKIINCSASQFLPANSLTCSNCPNGYSCSGGELIFDEYKSSGIDFTVKITHGANNVCATNFPRELYALWKLKKVTCSAGYYLPANIDECTKCLNDHYCPGGTYTFNETTPQGIIECPENHPFAPAGMWLASQCGRKLHVGNDILYMHQSPANPTEHRLYTIFNGTVYSVNATPKQNGVPDPKISAGMERSLHINLNGVEYLVHDDSVE